MVPARLKTEPRNQTLTQEKDTMKKLILIVCAAFALVGCNKEQGGAGTTSEQPSSGSSSSSTLSNTPSTGNDIGSQGSSRSTSGSATGTGADTNSSSPSKP